jgi:O-antigen/teichoic acid export membrane protein
MISRTVIATNFSTKEMGYYSFANNISTGVMLGFDSITWLIFPKMVAFFSQTDILTVDLENKIVSISKKINLFIFTSVIFLIICLPLLFRFFPDYFNSGKSVSLLLLTQAVLNSGFAIISLYVSRKKYIKLALMSSIVLAICFITAKCFVYLLYDFEWIAFSALIGGLAFINLLNYWGSVDFNLSYSKIISPFNHIMQICILIAAVCILLSNFWIALLAFATFFFFKKEDIIKILHFIKFRIYSR